MGDGGKRRQRRQTVRTTDLGRPHVRVPELLRGATAWFMEGDIESVLAATDAACQDALAGLDGRPPLGLDRKSVV